MSPAVASRLAELSDSIADSLDQNDVCTAAGRADDLHDAVVEAINNGEIPQAFQEELTNRANELVNEVNCPPPPTETDEEKKGKGKGHKKKDKQQDTTLTDTVTEPLPTTTGAGPLP